MKTFILFLYSTFRNHDEVENFCFKVLGKSKSVTNLRFVIENEKNIIVIFDSELGRFDMSKELVELLSIDIIKFYFLFQKESIYTAHLPIEMKDFIFKPKEEYTYLRLEYNNDEKPLSEKNNTYDFDLDSILEKIEELGIESLSEDEKKFLDNFGI